MFNKLKRIPLSVILVFILLFTLVSASLQAKDPACASSNIHQTYVYTLDSKYATCTYVQHVTSQLYFVLLFPFLITLPVAIILAAWFGYTFITQKKLTKDDVNVGILYVRVVLTLALCLSAVWLFGMANTNSSHP